MHTNIHFMFIPTSFILLGNIFKMLFIVSGKSLTLTIKDHMEENTHVTFYIIILGNRMIRMSNFFYNIYYKRELYFATKAFFV